MLFLHPLPAPATAVRDSALLDLWDSGFISFRIEPDGQFGYQVILDATNHIRFHLVEIGGQKIADVSFGPGQHEMARIRVEGDTLRVDWLGSDWLALRIARTGTPRHEFVSEPGAGDFVVVTASGAELRQFRSGLSQAPGRIQAGHLCAGKTGERAADLNERSWDVVGNASRSAEEYTSALRMAEDAVRLIPDNPDYWNTLGAALYRTGRLGQALNAIAPAEALRTSPASDDLAFRAMAHWKLGETAQAKAALKKLQDLPAGRPCVCSSDHALEAEALPAPKRN